MKLMIHKICAKVRTGFYLHSSSELLVLDKKPFLGEETSFEDKFAMESVPSETTMVTCPWWLTSLNSLPLELPCLSKSSSPFGISILCNKLYKNIIYPFIYVYVFLFEFSALQIQGVGGKKKLKKKKFGEEDLSAEKGFLFFQIPITLKKKRERRENKRKSYNFREFCKYPNKARLNEKKKMMCLGSKKSTWTRQRKLFYTVM